MTGHTGMTTGIAADNHADQVTDQVKDRSADQVEDHSASASESRIEELFHAALSETSNVTAFLQRQCGDDWQLFQSVYSLLQAAGGDNRILDAPISIGSSLRQQIDQPNRPELQLQSGDLLHNYQLRRRLGKGGMGTVFLAQELSPIQREVAIKLTNHQVDDDSTKSRLANERQTLAALNHPSIPTIFNAGVTPDGHTYLVLEYIEGTPIVRYCRQHDAPLGQRLDLFARLCETVSYIHQQGIIHRDLKSANVLVHVNGNTAEPFLVDFGIAKHLTGGQDHAPHTTPRSAASPFHTRQSDLLGTPGCMSPEQYLPGLPAADHRSDIYSLGLLLYRLLADQSPFPTSRINREEQLASLSSPATPAALNTTSLTWPTLLDDIALRCIQLQPEDRYATVLDLKRDIDSVRSSLHAPPTVVVPPRPSPKTVLTTPVPLSARPVRAPRSGSVRRSSLKLILTACIVGLFSPALNSLQTVTQTPAASSASDSASMVVSLPASDSPPQAAIQTVEVDGKTFGQIAAILDEQGLLPTMPARLVVTAEDDDVGLTIAHHQQAENLPVTANTHSPTTPGEKQSG